MNSSCDCILSWLVRAERSEHWLSGNQANAAEARVTSPDRENETTHSFALRLRFTPLRILSLRSQSPGVFREREKTLADV